MTELFGAIASWWTLSLIVVVFGFAPGFILRLLVKIYPREDPRRDELTAQLYVLGRLERPLFVAEQLETVLFEGLPHRMRAWRRRRSNRVRKSGNRDGMRAVFRRIVTTVVLGAVAFPFIQLLAASLYVQVALTAGFGSIVLLIQILIDFEERLAKVETGQIESLTELRRVVDQGFSKVGNDAQLFKAETVAVNTLIQRAAGIGPHTPRLASLLAQAEIDRLSGLLLALSEQEMILTTGDRDCLLGLVRSARESIDIVSVDTVDPVGDIVPCFWESYLGGSYLDLLWHAVRRNVRLRRLFVIEHGGTVNEPTLRQICDQARMGIQVRLIDASVALHATGGSLHDFALFDNAIRYEVASTRKVKQGDAPAVPCTRLVAHVAQVNESIQTYEHTWISATPWSGKDS